MSDKVQSVLEVADQAYHEGEGRIADGGDGGGDGLAQFIHDEIESVLDHSEDTLSNDLFEAARAMSVACDELGDVVRALESAAAREEA